MLKSNIKLNKNHLTFYGYKALKKRNIKLHVLSTSKNNQESTI